LITDISVENKVKVPQIYRLVFFLEIPGREPAMLIAQEHGGMSLRAIGAAAGGLQYSAVSDEPWLKFPGIGKIGYTFLFSGPNG
jgi:hypothetical protein